jgi:hypothetical protein
VGVSPAGNRRTGVSPVWLPPTAFETCGRGSLKLREKRAILPFVGKELVASRIVRRGKAYSQEQQEKLERLDEMLNPSPNQ